MSWALMFIGVLLTWVLAIATVGTMMCVMPWQNCVCTGFAKFSLYVSSYRYISVLSHLHTDMGFYAIPKELTLVCFCWKFTHMSIVAACFSHSKQKFRHSTLSELMQTRAGQALEGAVLELVSMTIWAWVKCEAGGKYCHLWIPHQEVVGMQLWIWEGQTFHILVSDLASYCWWNSMHFSSA